MSQLPSSSETGRITALLRAVGGGQRDALEELLPLVYAHLRRIAHAQLARERQGHTLDSVGLVSEAFLRLVGSDDIAWRSRAHFFAVAANAMRRILVDHARARLAEKRGGAAPVVPLADVEGAIGTAGTVASPFGATMLGGGEARVTPDRLLAIDEALGRLAAVDPDASRIVELRFYAGATEEEASEAVGVSPATARRRWAFAKAWLKRELVGQPAS